MLTIRRKMFLRKKNLAVRKIKCKGGRNDNNGGGGGGGSGSGGGGSDSGYIKGSVGGTGCDNGGGVSSGGLSARLEIYWHTKQTSSNIKLKIVLKPLDKHIDV